MRKEIYTRATARGDKLAIFGGGGIVLGLLVLTVLVYNRGNVAHHLPSELFSPLGEITTTGLVYLIAAMVLMIGGVLAIGRFSRRR